MVCLHTSVLTRLLCTAVQEETVRLQTEAQALEARVRELQARPEHQLTEKALLNAVLHEARRSQQLSLAVAQSAVSSSLVRLKQR